MESNSLAVPCPRCKAFAGEPCVRIVSGERRPEAVHAERVDLYDKTLAPRTHVPQPKRVPVDYRYDAILPDFLKMLARIGAYADEKYGSWAQYMSVRLEGEKSPLNHIREHLRQYEMGEPYDHFDGDPRWHLAAVAYNAQMEWWYHTIFGHARHPSVSFRKEQP